MGGSELAGVLLGSANALEQGLVHHPQQTGAERHGAHELNGPLRGRDIVDYILEVPACVLLVVRVKNVIESALGPLNLGGEQRLFSHVHGEVHAYVWNEARHALHLAENRATVGDRPLCLVTQGQGQAAFQARGEKGQVGELSGEVVPKAPLSPGMDTAWHGILLRTN